MRHKTIVLITLAILALGTLTGCATAPKKSSYSPAPSYDQDNIKAQIKGTLIDPESANFDFGPQKKAYQVGIMGGVAWKGYLAVIGVNAKNRMGGYAGSESYYVMWSDNDRTIHGPDWASSGRLRYADGTHVPGSIETTY